MVQLARLQPGEDLEEAHMRNRQMVSQWGFERGKAERVVERKEREGKTLFVGNDYEKPRSLFGELLRELQRVKSTGDFAAGKALVETYGVRVDRALHEEVRERYGRLNRGPYLGFINPRLVPVLDSAGQITDVRVEYPDDFAQQMLKYAHQYSFLSITN